MSAQHTPGPWTYAGRLGFGHLIDPNIAVAYGGDGSGRTEHGEANARLIAAAPELLEALIELEAAATEASATNVAARILSAAIHRARAAIAKAEGR